VFANLIFLYICHDKTYNMFIIDISHTSIHCGYFRQ